MDIFEKIASQQEGHDADDVWMVGEQLKDICRREPGCVSILMEDLENEDMAISKAAGKIKAYADSQRKGRSCVCVPPQKAEAILREFYGLPEAGPENTVAVKKPSVFDLGSMSLEDLLEVGM